MFKRVTHLSWLLVAFLGLSLALAACGDSPTATTNTNPTPAAVQVPTGVKSTLASNFPDSTVLYLTFNTDGNSSQAKGMQKVMDYLNQIPEIKMVTQNLDVLTLAKLGTYDGDVKPWLGNELAIGITDLKPIVELINATTSSSSSSAAPNLSEIPLLIGASITDQTKADAFVNKMAGTLKQAGVPDPTKETYKDATLYTFNYLVNIVVGISKDKLFIGGGTNVVKGAFDQAADKSLNNASSFKTVTGKLPAGNLAFFYFDYPTLSKTLSNLPQTKQYFASMNGMQMDYTGAMGGTFGIADEGLRIDSYSIYLPDKTPTAVAEMLKKGANPNKILNVVPENTLAFGNSRDAASAYDMVLNILKTSMASNPAMQTGSMKSMDIDQSLADFEKQTGLNVRNDIVGLFSGEFTFFVTPSATPQSFPIGIGLAAEATDKAATQTKLDKIEKAIESAAKGEVKWESKTVGTTTFKSAAVKDGNTQTSINLGIANGYSFLTLGDDTTSNLIGAANGGKNITNGANSANFNKVRDALSKDNTGYFYADIQAVINYAMPLVPASDVAKVKNVTDKLTKLSAIGATTRQNTTEAASTLYIYFPVTK